MHTHSHTKRENAKETDAVGMMLPLCRRYIRCSSAVCGVCGTECAAYAHARINIDWKRGNGNAECMHGIGVESTRDRGGGKQYEQ